MSESESLGGPLSVQMGGCSVHSDARKQSLILSVEEVATFVDHLAIIVDDTRHIRGYDAEIHDAALALAKAMERVMPEDERRYLA